ncbi:MAG: helix-turn-helix domain-containing protein [Lachnospiraceae bacterium]|jgi:transcriptional regulator with XRE-family HTH domain|nr:helix-turn-helix domain-containing protein [Lachnospiraceae bacterium]
MLTDFGKTLRKLRIDCTEIIKDMADKLGCTASYLSAVETGKRPVPEEWAEKIIALYHLDDNSAAMLRNAALAEVKSVKIGIGNLDSGKKETAILFAREFSDVDEETSLKIRELLKKGKGE